MVCFNGVRSEVWWVGMFSFHCWSCEWKKSLLNQIERRHSFLSARKGSLSIVTLTRASTCCFWRLSVHVFCFNDCKSLQRRSHADCSVSARCWLMLSEDFGGISEGKALDDEATKPRAFVRLHRQGEKAEYLLKEKLFPVWPHFVSQNYRVHSSKLYLFPN